MQSDTGATFDIKYYLVDLVPDCVALKLDYVDVQADLGLHIPYMSGDHLSGDVSHIVCMVAS